MTILEHITEQLPDGWAIRNLIFLDPDWQTNISDGEYLCIGTGDTIEEALAAASAKVFDCIYVGRFSLLEHAHRETREGSLLARLGLRKPTTPLRRRAI